MKPAKNSICFSLLLFLFAGAFQLSAASAKAENRVTDLLGRPVSVPANPQRVVALAANITEIVFALKQEHRLVGVTRYSDFPAAARELPKVGSYVHLDLERILALKPDLCLAIKDGNPRVVVERLTAMGIPVYAVDPRNLNSIMETIQAVGRLLNAEDTARELLQSMRRRIAHIQTLVSQAPRRPRVFFQIGLSPIVSVGTDTFIHELIEKAGGTNLAAGIATYPRFSREQVLRFLPEVIIITSMDRAAAFDQVKAEWSRWPSIPAVRDNKIFIEDSNLFDRPSPRIVDALERLAQRIHPELVTDSPRP